MAGKRKSQAPSPAKICSTQPFLIDSETKVGQESKFTIVVKNEFDFKLTGCQLTLEGQYMGNEVKNLEDLDPEESVEVNFALRVDFGVKIVFFGFHFRNCTTFRED